MNRYWAVGIVTFALAFAACAKKKGPETAGSAETAPTPAAETTSPLVETQPTPDDAAAAGDAEAAGKLPTVYFDYNQFSVRADAREPLKQAAETIKKNGSARVTVEGHCDERGSSEYNLALGERRAQSVKSYLRTLGVDGKQISTISYGKEHPVDEGHNEAAWAKNRRAELAVTR